MCLSEVAQIDRHDGEGYVVMREYSPTSSLYKEGDVLPLFGAETYHINIEYRAKYFGSIGRSKIATYVPGFHLIANLEDAEKFYNYHKLFNTIDSMKWDVPESDYMRYFIYKCSFREAYVRGRYWWSEAQRCGAETVIQIQTIDCIVANYRILLEKINVSI